MADLDFSKAVPLKPEELNFGKAVPLAKGGASKEEEPGFLKSVWDTAQGPVDILRGIGGAVQHPIDTLRGIGQQNADLMGSAVDSAKQGRPLAAIRQGLNAGINAAVPGLGASSEDAGKDLEAGRYRQGLGKTVGVGVNAAEAALAPRAVPKMAEGAAEGVSSIPRAGRAVAAGIKAGAPDIATGGAMIAGGEGLSHLIPGNPMLLHMALDYPGFRTAVRGLRSGAAAGMENWRGSLGDLVKPPEPEVTPWEANRPKKLANMPKYGGPAEPTTSQSGSSGGGARPMPGAPGSALIRKEIVQQHLGDPKLDQEAVLYGTDPNRPLITQRQVRIAPPKRR